MPAFNRRSDYQFRLVESIHTLFHRVCAVQSLNLTHEDYLELFVDPEHREMFRLAPKLGLCVGRSENSVEWPGGTYDVLSFTLHGENKPMAARSATIRSDANPELLARITSWVEERYLTGVRFGTARKVLDELVLHCNSPAQVRFFWPCLLTLCSLDRGLEPLAETVREAKTPKHIPALPVALRNACRESSGLLTAASMIPEHVIARGEQQVGVRFESQPNVHTELGTIRCM